MRRLFESLGVAVMAIGAIIILVQVFWISYGVIVRYFFNSPDAIVTEATALLLFPVAFAGLAYTLSQNAYPRVTFLADLLPPNWQRALTTINHFVILAVAVFFAAAALIATIRDFNSGAASEILLWERWIFWLPAALSWILFALYAGLIFIQSVFSTVTK